MKKTNWITPRTLSVIIAILMALLIGLGLRLSGGSEVTGVDSGVETATSSPLAVITVSATPTAIETETVAPRVTILALCRGQSSVTIHETCRRQFAEDGYRLGLGEVVTLIPSVAGLSQDFEFRLNRADQPLPGFTIDAAITELSLGDKHTVQIRFKNGDWSKSVEFEVDLLPPLAPIVTDVCVETRCAPRSSLPFIPNPVENAFYPVLVGVHGFMQGEIYEFLDQPYLWAELMLDGDSTALGCLNCDVAEAAGVLYPSRVAFGDSGYFYDWDVSSLALGSHTMQARFRNVQHTGPWSVPFIFEVE